MSEQNHGKLPQILSTGTLRLADTSPEAIERYLGKLRQLSPEHRIQGAAQLSRAAVGSLASSLPSAAPDYPTAESWRVLARARYGTLPAPIERYEPEYLGSVEEIDVVRFALTVGFALEAVGAWWCLSGALACSAFGEPHIVGELEFLVRLDPARAPDLKKHLGEAFWPNVSGVSALATTGESCTIFHLPSLMRVTLKDAKKSLDGSELPMRVPVEGATCGRIWALAAEDSIVRALCEWRDAEEGEEVFWREAAMLLAVQGEALDSARLDDWAKRLDLESILADARVQAGR
jgi:hypothetical protein